MELTTEGLFPNQFGCSYISYDQNGAAIPRESDPQLIFDRLFRNPRQIRRRDANWPVCWIGSQEDAKSLARNAGREDRQTLDQYLSVVRETEKRLQTMRQTEPKIDVEASTPGHRAT